jgi:OOP family OmpA-OmpF porin
MSKNLMGIFLFLTLILSVISYATETSMAPSNSFIAEDLNPKLQSGQLIKKVSHFEIIFNSNESMEDSYMGRRKFDIAKDIVSHINQTIPDLKLTSTFRIFGLDFKTGKDTTLVYGPNAYTRSEFEASLKKVLYPLGDSSLNVAIVAAYEDLRSTRGKKAVMIISDGKEMDRASLIAARKIKKVFGKRLCIYAIQIGNDSVGKTFLEKIVRAGGCGFYSQCDQLISSSGMANFVEKVFLTSGPLEFKKSAAVPTIPPPDLPQSLPK